MLLLTRGMTGTKRDILGRAAQPLPTSWGAACFQPTEPVQTMDGAGHSQRHVPPLSLLLSDLLSSMAMQPWTSA